MCHLRGVIGMARKRLIYHYSLSILLVSAFLVISTCFIFLPNHREMVGALSYLGGMQNLSFVELSDDLELAYDCPIPDEVGVTTEAYRFQVVNHGNRSVRYQLSLLTGTTANRVPQDSVHFVISKGDGECSEVMTLGENGELLLDEVSEFSTNTYSLQFWIRSDVDSSVIGKSFQAVINLTAVQ